MKATDEKPLADSRKSSQAQKKKSVVKKLTPEACKLLQTLSEKANKKTYGRKVRDSDLIAMGLSLIQLKHIEELQAQSLTSKDRLALAHEEYQKAHGKITLDSYLDKLIRGEIAVTQPLKA